MHFFLNRVFQKQPTFSFYSTGAFGAWKLKISQNKKIKKGEKKKKKKEDPE